MLTGAPLKESLKGRCCCGKSLSVLRCSESEPVLLALITAGLLRCSLLGWKDTEPGGSSLLSAPSARPSSCLQRAPKNSAEGRPLASNVHDQTVLKVIGYGGDQQGLLEGPETSACLLPSVQPMGLTDSKAIRRSCMRAIRGLKDDLAL